MAQHGLDPLLALRAPPRIGESTATTDRKRFSTALETAVDQRPAPETTDAPKAHVTPRTETADDAHDHPRDDASSPADREESAAAAEPAETKTPDQDEENQAATLTLTTATAPAEQAPHLSATTIVATPQEEGSLGVVATATPELPAPTTPPTLDAEAQTENLPTNPLPADPTGQDVAGPSLEEAAAGGVRSTDPTVASETDASANDLSTATLDGAAATAVAAEGEPTHGRPAGDGLQPGRNADATATTHAAGRNEQAATDAHDGEPESDADGRRAARAPFAEPAADEAAARADQVDVSPEAEIDHAATSHDDAAAKPDAERSSSTQEVAASRPWTRIGAARAVHPAAEAEPSDPAAMIDRPRFLQRISGAIEAAERRGGPIQVRLSPPELGSLRIELVMKHGTLAATVETETASARQVLLDNLPALRTRLAEQDIRVEQFDVDVRRDGRESADGGPSDRRPGEQSPERRPTRSTSVRSALEAPPNERGETIVVGDDGNLDVRI